MIPVAWFAACRPRVVWSMRKARSMARQNIHVCSGTYLLRSQKSRMSGISMIMGIARTIIKAVENLLSLPAKESISCLSLFPSAFMICGFMAFSTDVETKRTAPFTWVARPKAALIAVPKKWLNTTDSPWVWQIVDAIPYVVHPANPNSLLMILLSTMLFWNENWLSWYFAKT